MTEPKLRCVAKETQEWRLIRDAGLAGLAEGVKTGDFSEAPRDLAVDQVEGFPLTQEIQQSYMDVLGGADLTTKTTYFTGLELQLNLLESARRTTAVLRGTRAAALAQMQLTPEDAAKQNTLLDDLILSDDLPVGTAESSSTPV